MIRNWFNTILHWYNFEIISQFEVGRKQTHQPYLKIIKYHKPLVDARLLRYLKSEYFHKIY